MWVAGLGFGVGASATVGLLDRLGVLWNAERSVCVRPPLAPVARTHECERGFTSAPAVVTRSARVAELHASPSGVQPAALSASATVGLLVSDLDAGQDPLRHGSGVGSVPVALPGRGDEVEVFFVHGAILPHTPRLRNHYAFFPLDCSVRPLEGVLRPV